MIKQQMTNKNIIYTEIFLYLIVILLMMSSFKNTKNKFYTISCFFLPVKKNKIKFLRAPYKNKLAQLDIVRLHYTFILIFKNFFQKNTNINIVNFSKISNLIRFFHTLTINGTKLRHIATKTKFSFKLDNNFLLKNFF